MVSSKENSIYLLPISKNSLEIFQTSVRTESRFTGRPKIKQRTATSVLDLKTFTDIFHQTHQQWVIFTCVIQILRKRRKR
jgi:hypothetical protein